MNLEYFYCSHCGYESFDIYVAFSATYASGDYCVCPDCKKETYIHTDWVEDDK